jgi:hypothetical protein
MAWASHVLALLSILPLIDGAIKLKIGADSDKIQVNPFSGNATAHGPAYYSRGAELPCLRRAARKRLDDLPGVRDARGAGGLSVL